MSLFSWLSFSLSYEKEKTSKKNKNRVYFYTQQYYTLFFFFSQFIINKKEPSKRKALTVAWQRSSLTGRKPNYIRR